MSKIKLEINDNQTEATINGVEYLLTPKEITVSKPETYTIEQLKTEKIAVRCENTIQSGTFSTELGLIGLACYPIRVFWNSHLLRWDWILFNGNTVRHNFTKTIPFSQVQFPEKRDWEVKSIINDKGRKEAYDKSFGEKTFPIHSVLRSDGVEFSAKEEAQDDFRNCNSIIRSFEVLDGLMIVEFENGARSSIMEISKPSKKALFKTEDGVEVCKGDEYFTIGDQPVRGIAICSKEDYLNNDIRFKRRENALQYISDNKPEYSKRQILEAIKEAENHDAETSKEVTGVIKHKLGL